MKACEGFAFTFLGMAQSVNKLSKAFENLSIEMNRLRTHSEAKEFVIKNIGLDSYQNSSLRRKIKLIKINKIKNIWQK